MLLEIVNHLFKSQLPYFFAALAMCPILQVLLDYLLVYNLNYIKIWPYCSHWVGECKSDIVILLVHGTKFSACLCVQLWGHFAGSM